MSQPSFDFGDDEPALDDAGNPTYSVSELADAINAQLRRGFDDGVWVRGEIDGLTRRGPHVYFSLVEDGADGRAVLRVSLFRFWLGKLTPLLKKNRLELANGMKVRIFGELDYYAPSGQLGLKMTGLDPRFTLGELSQARDQVVRRLVAAGLFDANRRHAFPLAPLRIGVVTSVEGAAWRDFRHQLERSGFGFRITVCDTRVQGDGAEHSVAAAIRTLAGHVEVDVVVVVRGGGARNDLATFDAEPIALAIATSPVPVVTGLGHEIDRSVADDVAHTVAITPTAAARKLIDAVAAYREAYEERYAAIARRAGRDVQTAQAGLVERAHRVAGHTRAAIERASERLAARQARLVAAPGRVLERQSARLDTAAGVVTRRPRASLEREAERLGHVEARVRGLDPVHAMRRGWSITRTTDGRVVRSTADAAPGDRIVTHVADGSLTSTVDAP